MYKKVLMEINASNNLMKKSDRKLITLLKKTLLKTLKQNKTPKSKITSVT